MEEDSSSTLVLQKTQPIADNAIQGHRDIRHFGKPGEEAATREIRQILDTEALIPTESSSLSWKERKEALECSS